MVSYKRTRTAADRPDKKSVNVSWKIDEQHIKQQMRKNIKKFTSRQKQEVRKALRKLGQDETNLMVKYLKGKGGRAKAVSENAYFQTQMDKDSNDYPVLEIGVKETLPRKGRGSKNSKGLPEMDLSSLIFTGGKKPAPLRSVEHPERNVWFGNNWPGTPKTLAFKLQPGKSYGKAIAPIPFLKVRQKSVEKRLPKFINDALAKTAQDLRREQGRKL